MLRTFARTLAVVSMLALPAPAFAYHSHSGGGGGGGARPHYSGGGPRIGGGVYRGGRGYGGGGGRRFWGGRWWPYGVGPCWRFNPFFGRWVWVCY